jgi:hypothetical protein
MNSCSLGSTPFFFFDLVALSYFLSSSACSGTSWMSSLTLLGLIAALPRDAVLSRKDLLSDLVRGFYSFVIVLLLLSFSFGYLVIALELFSPFSVGFSGLFEVAGVVFGTLLDEVILLAPMLLVLIEPSISFLPFFGSCSVGSACLGEEEGGAGADTGRTGACPDDVPQPMLILLMR